METYIVNKNEQPNKDHEVHTLRCFHLPALENRLNLGVFSNCKDAVKEAKKTYPISNGCYHCCLPCHTT